VTLSPALEKLLRELGPEGPRSLEHLQQALYNVRFTGPFTVHCVGGRPRQIDLGAPSRLSIMEGGLDSTKPTKPG